MSDTGFINRCRTWFRSFWQRVRGIESKWTWYEIDARNNMVKINKAPNLFMTLQWIVIMSFKVSCHFHASCLKCHCTYELFLTKAFRYMIKIMICHCVITREGDWPLHIGSKRVNSDPLDRFLILKGKYQDQALDRNHLRHQALADIR